MAHKFEPLKKEPAYLKVYNAVEAEIVSGALAQGAALATETALCDQFGVTRATVREGLRLLEQADLVQRGAAKRFYVKRPDPSDMAAATSKSLALGGVTFREVWEALQLMYPQAARLAVKRLGRGDIKALRAGHARYQRVNPRDADAVVEGAVAFFQTIAAALNNRVLLAMLQSLNGMIGASLRQVIRKTPKAYERIFSAQGRIIDALEKKDEDQVIHWMAKHIDDLKRGYSVAKVELEKSVL